MRFAYADPPYLGQCARYDHDHPDGRCWNNLETHRLLIESLGEYDGWALSLSSTSLRDILPMCPPDVRVMAWVKTWVAPRSNVSPAYAWEPVIIRGQRKGRRKTERRMLAGSVFDWMRSIPRRETFQGAKPDEFVWWVLACLNAGPDDELADLFHGSGAVSRAMDRWRAQAPLELAR